MFSLYAEQQGGSALWTELQNVTLDANGQYTVLLGSQHSEGVPAELFTTNEARWLGIQVEAAAEQARVLLVSVPYAFKAHEAETLGGKPASAFALAPQGGVSKETNSAANASGSGGPRPLVVGHGEPGYIAYWKNGVLLGDSVVYQSENGNVGVSTANPGAPLTVVGSAGTEILGENTAKSGLAVGVTGYADASANGTGVLGEAKAASGTTTGVFGIADATSGAAIGVSGHTASPAGVGGLFQNLSTQAGAKLLVAEDSQNNQRFSVDNQGNVSVLMGSASQPASLVPVNHGRLTQELDDGMFYTLDVPWTFPFPDTNYTVTCTPQIDTPSGVTIYYQISTSSTTAVQLYAGQEGYTSIVVTFHCIGVHD